MHEHLFAFLETAVESFPLRGPVYEFGVSTALGSAMPVGLRELLGGAGDTTWDLPVEPRPARLEESLRLPFPDGAARTVLSTHLLEPVQEPRQALDEMMRILAPGGMLLLCWSDGPAARLSERSRQPTPGEMQNLFARLEATLVGWQGAERHAHTLYGIGCKAPVPEAFLAGVNCFLDRFQQRVDQWAARETWGRKLWRLLTSWRESPLDRCKRRDYLKTQFVLHLPVSDRFQPGLLAGCTPHSHLGSRLNRRV